MHVDTTKCLYAERHTRFLNYHLIPVKKIKSALTLHQKDIRWQVMKIFVHVLIPLADWPFMHVRSTLFIQQLAKKCILKFLSRKSGALTLNMVTAPLLFQ